MPWPQYHRDTEEGQGERRVAASLSALVMLRWRRDYARQRVELRKRERAEERGDDD